MMAVSELTSVIGFNPLAMNYRTSLIANPAIQCGKGKISYMQIIKLHAKKLSTEKRRRRFARLGTLAERLCPWCYQIAVAYKATKKRVQFWCPKRCGYRASIPKCDLSFEEKKRMYGQ